MKKHTLIFIFILLTLFSCKDEVVIDLPHQEEKLVLKSIGQDGDFLIAGLSLSYDVLDESSNKPFPNSILNIYQDDTFIESLSPLNSDEGGYFKSNTLKLLPGKRYKLEATALHYHPVVANYTHPLPVQVENLEVKPLGQSQYPGANNIQFKVSFTDPPESNYYEVVIMGDTNVHPDFVISSQVFGLTFTDPAYKNPVPSTYGPAPTIFTDTYFNGKQVTFEFESIQINEIGIKRYFVYLRTLSKELYWYLKTSQLQTDTRNDAFAQPVKVESNIENGFGIFGGVTQTYKVVVLP